MEERLRSSLDERTGITGSLKPNSLTHGVLVSISDRGILILGQSGAGKSDLALELIADGNALVADDVVELFVVDSSVYGQAPERFSGIIQISGLGIFDVTEVFGPSAYKKRIRIDACVDLDREDQADPFSQFAQMEVAGQLLPCFGFGGRSRRNLKLLIDTATKLIDNKVDVAVGKFVEAHDRLVSTKTLK